MKNKEKIKNEELINNALSIDFSKVKEDELLTQVVAKLIAIKRIDKDYALSLEEDTAYYLCVLLSALTEGGYYRYIEAAYSEKTVEAFEVINATSYGKLFDKYNTALMEGFKNVKGLFKGFKKRRLLSKLTLDFKSEWEELDAKDPLVPNYINPYLKTKVIPILDKFNSK